jgi:hypothetical protein
VGLHFSTHQYFESTPDGTSGEAPGQEKLVDAINDEREVLSRIIEAPIDVVSFHNPPEWTFRRSFEDFVSTYESRFYDGIEYTADSNQRWRDDEPFADELPKRLQILTHPVLWGEKDAYATDRLREERDYCFERIEEHLTVTDRTWRTE